jgi:hypothetical protein
MRSSSRSTLRCDDRRGRGLVDDARLNITGSFCPIFWAGDSTDLCVATS